MGTSGDKIVLLDGIGGGGDSYNAMVSMIPGLLANALGGSKMDPNLVAALMNGRNNQDQFGGANGWWMWVILMFFLWGGRGFGNAFGNGEGCCHPLPNQLNNNYGLDLLLQAIQGNRTATEQVAGALNCTTTQLQNDICNIQGAIDKVAGQVGMTSQGVINAVQQTGCQIGNAISSCCCQLQGLINQTSCATQNLITSQGYEGQMRTVQQTNELNTNLNNGLLNLNERFTNQYNILSAKIDAQTQAIAAQFNGLEKRELQREINTLRDEKNALQASALTQAQTQNLIAQLRPTAVPCYPSCSPYQAYNWGQVFGNSCGNCCGTNNCCQTNCCNS